MTSVTVAMLAYGEEPWLPAAVDAVLASVGVEVTVRLVDNGCTGDGVDVVAGRAGVTVLRPAENTGFAGGCNLALAGADGDVVALVNSDALVAPDALARLAAVALEDGVGIASGSIRLASDPGTMNSAGNPVTYVGLSWAGGLGDPATAHADRVDVTAASGAGLALRRTLWEELDGFDPEFFAYCEDADLSLRCWQSGRRVVYVPDAVVLHHYEFSRNPRKLFLLERNRLLMMATCFERRTLLAVAPMLLLIEVGMLGAAVAGRWGPQKLRGWWWLVTHTGHVRERRAWVQSRRRTPDAELLHLLSARFTPRGVPLPPGFGVVNVLLAGYWGVARRRLARASRADRVGSRRRPGTA